MSRYNQSRYYYDPTGSASYQPTGNTYQDNSNYQYGRSTYSNQQQQQHAANTTQQTSNSASHAAAALSSLSNHNYNQTSSSGRSTTGGQYDTSQWYPSNTSSNAYSNSNVGLTNRSQSNDSPLYAPTQSVSTFGRWSLPEQAQSSSLGAPSTHQTASSNSAAHNYQTGYAQAQTQPQRYNSPLRAVQAQRHAHGQGHSKQPSRDSHKPSPQMANAVHNAQQQVGRQGGAPVEPSPTTVDPSQVYDNRAELQRKAQVEAERRRKYEAEQAARKAEEERLEAEKCQAEEEKKQAEQGAKKKADAERKKKAREEKKQSKNAASALTKMASGSSAPTADSDEEAEMRAMFQRMREFNAKNPAMLAKLWEEERKTHMEAQSPQVDKPKSVAASKSTAVASAPSAASPQAAPSNKQNGAKPKNDPVYCRKPMKMPNTSYSPAAQVVAAASSPTQPSNSSQSSASLWPPHKKGTLADATAKWLRSQPTNATSIITAQTVLNILNGNPSYVQLCESLEALGLRFDRPSLARELLRAVPDGLKAQPTAKPSTPGGSGSAAEGVKGATASSPTAASRPMAGNANVQAPTSLSELAREVNSMSQPAAYSPPAMYHGTPTPGPYNAQARPVSSSNRGPSQSVQPDIKPEIKPEEPRRPPADKEEAARKRTFGDLVDLTAEDSEEDSGPPMKKFVIPTSAPGNEMNAEQTTAYGQAPPSFQQYAFKPSSDPTYSYSSFGTFQPPGPGAAIGAHQPNGLPQPPHPPPVLPSQPSKPRGPSAEQLQRTRMKGKMLVEPIMRDRVARKSKYDSRTIARDVLLATGRHPDMRGLNAHLAAMQKLLGAHGGEPEAGGGNSSDLATVRWDLIDPEPTKVEEAKRPETARSIEAADGIENASETASIKPPAARTSTTVDYEVPNATGEAWPKRRGRPPKALKEWQSMLSLTKADNLGTPDRQSSTAPRVATPSSVLTNVNANTMTGGKPVGYAQLRQVDEEGKVIKKKGRPIGWRKAIHSREAAGLEPASNANKSKEPKQFTPKKEKQVVDPLYQVYKCQWGGCSAELHNLDTLKKHIVKVHGTENDANKYECWWKGCGAATRHEGKVANFDTIEEWIGHVEEKHMNPIGWKLGDGPQVRDFSTGSSTPPAYLLDRDGRSVTPIIIPAASREKATTAKSEQDDTGDIAHESSPAPPTPAPKLGPGRPPKGGISKAKAGTAAPLRELEQHLKIVGPTMDRMGCVLATDGRRRGFVDDEDFEDEVEGSEHDPGDDE